MDITYKIQFSMYLVVMGISILYTKLHKSRLYKMSKITNWTIFLEHNALLSSKMFIICKRTKQEQQQYQLQ